METITQHSKGGYVTKSQRHTISRVSVCAYDMKNGSQRCGISKDTMESLLFLLGHGFYFNSVTAMGLALAAFAAGHASRKGFYLHFEVSALIFWGGDVLLCFIDDLVNLSVLQHCLAFSLCPFILKPDRIKANQKSSHKDSTSEVPLLKMANSY